MEVLRLTVGIIIFILFSTILYRIATCIGSKLKLYEIFMEQLSRLRKKKTDKE